MSIIIVGGGLSGLLLGYRLHKANIPFKILESQNRIGGRIQTIYGKNDTPMELGATWFADYHYQLIELLKELNIEFFPQHTEGIALLHTRSFEPPQKFYVAASDGVSYRIKDGSSALVNALAAYIPIENILLNTCIKTIEDKGTQLLLSYENNQIYNAETVVLAMPPQLLSLIGFSPALPSDLNQLLPNVQTWMSGSVKFTLEYEQPFWRQNGFAGTIYSHAGMAVEVYDQSNFEENKFALVGFLNGSAYNYSVEDREKIVSAQIKELFGEITPMYLSYSDKIWNDTHIAKPTEKQLMGHQNNGHPLLKKSYYNSKLFLSGTETSKSYPGYMEGAIQAADSNFKIILNKINMSAIEQKLPLPPFTEETAKQKIQMAEDAWNSKDPERVSKAYTIDSEWRNRDLFITGREAIVAFLSNKWNKEIDYKLKKEYWAHTNNRIAVRFEYEYRNENNEWFRAYGNENWEFDENGLMAKRFASINDLAIQITDRRL